MTSRIARMLAVACVFVSGSWRAASAQDAAVKPATESAAARRQRLRGEFLAIAAPLIEERQRQREQVQMDLASRRIRRMEAATAVDEAKLAVTVCEASLIDLKKFMEASKTDLGQDAKKAEEARLDWARKRLARFQRALADFNAAAAAKEGKPSPSEISARVSLEEQVEMAKLNVETYKISLSMLVGNIKETYGFPLLIHSWNLTDALAAKRSDLKRAERALEVVKEEESNLKKNLEAFKYTPDEKRILALLSDVASWSGSKSPSELKQDELGVHLDRLETKITEARRLTARIREANENKRFDVLSARAHLLSAANPVPDDDPKGAAEQPRAGSQP